MTFVRAEMERLVWREIGPLRRMYSRDTNEGTSRSKDQLDRNLILEPTQQEINNIPNVK